ncbi:carboxymuconolactone decarboxylase family protein [Actinoplanes sp. NPDC049596]|uniref:carboxymuconolactone decarboxylase family protein n=1 Tax=unclassified Actinoplanes TaxID=2626549 RepID=UPI00343FEC02
MPHIDLPPLPGIAGLLAAYPDTAGALNGLAETLLRGPSPLSPAQRESIAAYVSLRNDCTFCSETHGAVARRLAQKGDDAVMPELLAIADKVRLGGHEVTAEDVARARRAGADDRMIHDTVLIAAAFSMFNRYVDGLATIAPAEPAHYERHAGVLAEQGYLTAPAAPAATSGSHQDL